MLGYAHAEYNNTTNNIHKPDQEQDIYMHPSTNSFIDYNHNRHVVQFHLTILKAFKQQITNVT